MASYINFLRCFVFKHISQLLNNFVPTNDEWKVKLFNNWDKVLGNLSEKVFILKVERNFLLLGVTHPALAHEMFMLSDVLKNKINSLFDRERIKHIRFQVVKKQQNLFAQQVNQDLEKICDQPVIKKISLNRVEYSSLSKVKDNELKGLLKDFYLKSKKENYGK